MGRVISRIESELKAAEETYGIPSSLVKAIVLSPLIIVFLYCLLLVLPITRSTALLMLQENYPVELLTFGFLVWGGIRGLVLARQTKNRGEGILVFGFYAVFSVLLLFDAMEEAAWGQQFFGFMTPSALRDINVQGEVTIHNIRGLQGHSEFFRFPFGLGGLFGVWLSSWRYFRNIGVPVILSSWFFVISVFAGIDLYNDYFPIQKDFDFIIWRMSEVVEMMIGISGLLFIWLNARMLSSNILRLKN